MTDNALTPFEQFISSDSVRFLDRGPLARMQDWADVLAAKSRAVSKLSSRYIADADDVVAMRGAAIDVVIQDAAKVVAAETLGRVLDGQRGTLTVGALREAIADSRERMDVTNSMGRRLDRAIKPYRNGVMAASGRSLDTALRLFVNEQYDDYLEKLDSGLPDERWSELNKAAETVLLKRTLRSINTNRFVHRSNIKGQPMELHRLSEPIDVDELILANQAEKVANGSRSIGDEIKQYEDQLWELAAEDCFTDLSAELTTDEGFDLDRFDAVVHTLRARALSKMTVESPLANGRVVAGLA